MKKLFVLLSVAFGLVSAPATFAQKPQLRVVPKTVTIEASASDNGQTQIIETDVEIRQIYVDYVKRTGTCKTVDCDDTGDGSKGDWKKFWEAKKSQKPAELAKAIKGIGETTAERILEAGYFKSKPRSWRAFSREINDAQDDLKRDGYSYNFASAVLEQYGYDNSVNLGYSTANSCTVREYPCTVWDEVLKESHYKYVPVKARFKATRMVLQSFETEKFALTFSTIPEDTEVEMANWGTSAHNKYNLQTMVDTNGNAYITAEGMGRIKNAVPASAVTSASLTRTADGFLFNVKVDPKYLPREDAGSKLVISYEVCNTSWIGTCYEVVREAKSAYLNAANNNLKFSDGKYKSRSKYFVRYRIARTDSKYYSNKYSSENETSSARY